MMWNPDADVEALTRGLTDGLCLESRGADSELVYRLDLRFRTPGGYDGSLPDTWIYLP